jgi:MoaA/NifB/PqqE/SkfB family radical SAM enzyme
MTEDLYSKPWKEYPKVSSENSPEEWDHFQSKRNIPESDKIISCYAAFNHMRIGRTGNIKPCCFALKNMKWEKGKKGLRDYWFGEVNEEYRQEFLNNTIHHGCKKVCGSRIKNKVPPPIHDYDWNPPYHNRLKHAMDSVNYPKVFEFEISNLCNMACPMCLGELSSKHMLGRDKDLKVYEPNVFDDDENLAELLEQLKEFIPHLETIRFTGGEPFAHKGFYKIAQLIVELNPNMEIDITTNGSIYNKKVDRFCDILKNMKISLSLDTVDPDEYALIRIGGKYENTFANIQKFKDKLGSHNVKINSTLMSINAPNIDKFFKYGYENNFGIFVNVYDRSGRSHTEDFSLTNLSNDHINEIINKLKPLAKIEDVNNHFVVSVNKTINLLKQAIT